MTSKNLAVNVIGIRMLLLLWMIRFKFCNIRFNRLLWENLVEVTSEFVINVVGLKISWLLKMLQPFR